MEEVLGRYCELTRSFQKLLTLCQGRVAEWRWSQGRYYALDATPFEVEWHPPTRWIDPPAAEEQDQSDFYRYGLDAEDRPWLELKHGRKLCFYLYGENVVESYHPGQRRAAYERLKISESLPVVYTHLQGPADASEAGPWWLLMKKFYHERGRLVRIEEIRRRLGEEGTDEKRYFGLGYDLFGRLSMVSRQHQTPEGSVTRICYEKTALTPALLARQVADHLVYCLPQLLERAEVKEPVYCLAVEVSRPRPGRPVRVSLAVGLDSWRQTGPEPEALWDIKKMQRLELERGPLKDNQFLQALRLLGQESSIEGAPHYFSDAVYQTVTRLMRRGLNRILQVTGDFVVLPILNDGSSAGERLELSGQADRAQRLREAGLLVDPDPL